MASEKRLIDANALCDLLDVEYKRKMKLVRKGENHLDTLAEGIMSISVLLGTMPTVDAVEVVRCKDCKHRGTDYCIFHIKGEPADEELLRKLDNDFCSYGERREGE